MPSSRPGSFAGQASLAKARAAALPSTDPRADTVFGHATAGEINAFLSSEGGNGRLKEERALLKQALEDVQGMIGALIGYLTGSQQDPQSIYKVGQHSVRLLLATGDLLIGWLLQRQAEVALQALSGEVSARDKAFYEGKVAVASFFARNVLPELSAGRKIIEGAENSIMELDESAF